MESTTTTESNGEAIVINGRNAIDGTFASGHQYGWKKGQSGNPNGRTKGSKTGAAALREQARKLIDPKSGLTADELIAAKLIALAMDGDLKAIELFYNRTEGKPGIRIAVEGE